MCRQVEDQTTQMALKIIWIHRMNAGQQLFHVKQKESMLACMLLS
jgi:hypothetical protein